MDVSIRGLMANWLPQAPNILKTLIQIPLGWSPNARYQDWWTEVLVQCARPVLQSPAALLKSQEFFKWDIGIWGPMWVAKSTIPAPVASLHARDLEAGGKRRNDTIDIQQAISFAIEALASYDDERSCPIPSFDEAGVEVEWTSYRRNVQPWSFIQPALAEQLIYDGMLTELPGGSDSPVILFAHGGAFCLMDPANHRLFASRLARNSGSRVVNVRYRLSPQSTFPAALMDMFLAYLSLLSPPPGSLHEAVAGNKIILAGDSSGGNLVASLQVLLTTLVQHGNTEIQSPWHANEIITIPNPPTAALSLASPWLDITRSLPSCTLNSRYDFIAPPAPLEPSLMSTSPLFPPDEIWPADPARTETYCEAVMCAHPLVSPLMSPMEVLAGFPALYACTGWEGMTDETEVFVRRVVEARKRKDEREKRCETTYARLSNEQPEILGCEIVFDGYIGMPHTFAFVTYNRAGVKADRNRANHIMRAVAGQWQDHDHTTNEHEKEISKVNDVGRATWTDAKTMKQVFISFMDLGMTSEFSGYDRKESLTDEIVFKKVDEGRRFRVDLERRLREDEIALKGQPS